ncbi:MAG: hypothetical protein WAK86_12500 [Pseudonocardiaceae bacterium]
MTHVLLPVLVLVRRADVAVVIGAALAAKAEGSGHQRIAAGLGRAAETVRGWLRCFAGRIEAVRAVFTWWCRARETDPVSPGPAGSDWADVLAAITAAAAAVAARFGLGTVARPAGPNPHRRPAWTDRSRHAATDIDATLPSVPTRTGRGPSTEGSLT